MRRFLYLLAGVMRHGFNGAVLSWNVMEVPDSHISCFTMRRILSWNVMEAPDSHISCLGKR